MNDYDSLLQKLMTSNHYSISVTKIPEAILQVYNWIQSKNKYYVDINYKYFNSYFRYLKKI